MRRMGVKKSHPEVAFDLFDLAEQRRQGRAARRIDGLTWTRFFGPEIHSVVSRILADQVNLPNTFGDERPNFGKNRFGRAAAMFAAHLRNDAKTARVVAAFGDLEKYGMSRSEAKTRGIVIWNVSRTRTRKGELISGFGTLLVEQTLHDFAEFRDLVQADERIYFGDRLPQLVSESLRHATAYDQLLIRALVQSAPLVGFENGFDRFFLRRIDKRAGIDHENVGFVGLGRNLHPALQDASEHDFRVDQIFRATETDHSDFASASGRASWLVRRALLLCSVSRAENGGMRGDAGSLIFHVSNSGEKTSPNYSTVTSSSSVAIDLPFFLI